MIKKTLCFSNQAHLSLRLGQLVIRLYDEDGGETETTRPIEDIGVIVMEGHSITMTSALLSFLMDNNVAVVICDSKHMPSGLMFPLAYNSKTTEKTLFQINSSLPLRKQLWQQTISSKIFNQGYLLSRYYDGYDGYLLELSKRVKSGDPENLESRAAVYYWKNLFPKGFGFTRGDDDHTINALLNYGYAILRAVIARAIVSSGLIPAIGIFHSNKYNPYCLADDVMEPYRPFVDRVVLELTGIHGIECGLTKEIKAALLKIPVMDLQIGKLKRPLMVAASITTASLAKCFSGESRKIIYPTFIHDADI